MVFSSTVFLFFFLPVFLLAYFLTPGIRIKNIILLVFSLIFYAWGEPVYVILMLFSMVVNYFLGCLMEDDPAHKKHTLVFAIILNLAILGFFKYYGFAVTTVNDIFGTAFEVRDLPLPIGISFYTFQTLSYIIDLYRGKFQAQRSFIRFGMYITMFFQLIAGPIVRYEDVEKQLEKRHISKTTLGRGLPLFVFGLAKKVLIANMVGSLFDTITASGSGISTVTAWLGAIAYTLQIYFDFSGYSDMAVGLGKMCGFDFPENFDSPYVSDSVTVFWRRWHISLGTWFREYVYIPLGGNRVGKARHIFNILVVWMLTGLWHGASWNFVIWGLYYGILLLLEKYLGLFKRLPAFFRHLKTLLLVVIGWVIFSSESFGAMSVTLKSMFGFAALGGVDGTALYYLVHYGPLLIIGMICCLPFVKKLRDVMIEKRHFALLIVTAGLFFLSVAFLATQNYNPFLYFRF